MADHRAPERRALPNGASAASGPVEPVDTDQTQTIDMTQAPAPSGATPTLAAVQPPAAGGTGKRPEPVMSAARLAGAISGAILAVGGLLKMVTPWVPTDYDLQPIADQASDAVLSIGVCWALVGPWITARINARDKVTPLEDPRDITGAPLVAVSAR